MIQKPKPTVMRMMTAAKSWDHPASIGSAISYAIQVGISLVGLLSLSRCCGNPNSHTGVPKSLVTPPIAMVGMSPRTNCAVAIEPNHLAETLSSSFSEGG